MNIPLDPVCHATSCLTPCLKVSASRLASALLLTSVTPHSPRHLHCICLARSASRLARSASRLARSTSHLARSASRLARSASRHPPRASQQLHPFHMPNICIHSHIHSHICVTSSVTSASHTICLTDSASRLANSASRLANSASRLANSASRHLPRDSRLATSASRLATSASRPCGLLKASSRMTAPGLRSQIYRQGKLFP